MYWIDQNRRIRMILALFLLLVFSVSLSVAETTHKHAICGNLAIDSVDSHEHVTHSDKVFLPWDGDLTKLDKSPDTAYYLIEDTMLTNAINVYADETLNLCLNGYKLIQSENKPAIRGTERPVINICDCSESRMGTITHAAGKTGNALYVTNGNTALYGITVSGNVGASSGGGICSSHTGDSAKLYIEDCAIINNVATYEGGGVFSAGELIVIDSLIDGNEASQQSGGGIYAWGTITITNTAISNNKALNGADGGIHGYGESDDLLIITGSSIVDNEAVLSAGVGTGSNSVRIENSIISGNKSTHWGAFSGGGNSIQFKNVNITDNSNTGIFAIDSNRNNNAVPNLIVSGGKISGNGSISSDGGGINSNYNITLKDGAVISNNKGRYGGGILVSTSGVSTGDGNMLHYSGSLNVIDGRIVNNVATAGGGIYCLDRFGTIVKLNSGSITGNTASETGAGIYLGGAICITTGNMEVTDNHCINENQTSRPSNIYLVGEQGYIQIASHLNKTSCT